MKTAQKIAVHALLLLPLCLSNMVKAENSVATSPPTPLRSTERGDLQGIWGEKFLANYNSTNSKQASKRSCSISGQLYGSGLESDRSYFIVPSNTNGSSRSSKMTRIDPSNPSYQLSSLPQGHYVLRVFRSEAGSLLPVRTYPRQRLIRCSGNEIKNVDFELE